MASSSSIDRYIKIKNKCEKEKCHQKADYIEFITNGHSLIRFHGINQEMVPKKTILTSSDMMTIRFVSEPQYYTLPGKGFKIVVNLFARKLIIFLNRFVKIIFFFLFVEIQLMMENLKCKKRILIYETTNNNNNNNDDDRYRELKN